jgi:uncharacterized protein YndB with AHSA1/START domain
MADKTEESRFVYVTFIRTTAERLWQALTDAEFTKQYWMGVRVNAEWKPGGAWQLVFPDGRIADTGEVLEIDPPRRLVVKWRNEFMPEMKAEGYSQCVMELEPLGETIRLTITHTMERADSKFIQAVTGGWPQILSNLKSLLETGTAMVLK